MVYVYLADGFEEVEALTVIDILRRGGVDVKSVSVTSDKTVHGTHGINVEADILFEDAHYDDCEMIVLPGGMPGASNLEEHEGLREKLIEFADNDRKISAICAAPMVLGSNNILKGRKATIYPGMEDRLVGADAAADGVVTDGNIITGQGPAFAMDFALAVLRSLKGNEVTDEVAEGLLYKQP